MRLRRTVASALDEVARVAGKLADRIDPPRPLPHRPAVYEVSGEVHLADGQTVDLGRQLVHADNPDDAREQSLQRLASRLRHPAYTSAPETILGDVSPPEDPRPLAPVLPLRPEESP